MSQVVLELANQEDLNLLLSLAKRLNLHVVSVKSDSKKESIKNRRAIIQKMANDPLFIADVSDITEDFKHIDK
jgi:hypothetical protein